MGEHRVLGASPVRHNNRYDPMRKVCRHDAGLCQHIEATIGEPNLRTLQPMTYFVRRKHSFNINVYPEIRLFGRPRPNVNSPTNLQPPEELPEF